MAAQYNGNDTTLSLGHNWFGDEWPSLGLTEEEFLAEYSKTLDKLADTHTRLIPIFVWIFLNTFALNIALPRHGYSAAVFTQTTDVEGEINGFFTYDRQACVSA